MAFGISDVVHRDNFQTFQFKFLGGMKEYSITLTKHSDREQLCAFVQEGVLQSGSHAV